MNKANQKSYFSFAIVLLFFLALVGLVLLPSAHAEKENGIIKTGFSDNCYWDEDEGEFCDEEIEDNEESENWQECADPEKEESFYCQADLAVTSGLPLSPLQLDLNQKRNFLVSVENKDNSPANGVELLLHKDNNLIQISSSEKNCNLDSGDQLCLIDSLSPGESQSFRFQINSRRIGSGTFSAFVIHHGEDPWLENDEITWRFRVGDPKRRLCQVPAVKRMKIQRIKRNMRRANCKARFIRLKTKSSKRNSPWRGVRSSPKPGKRISNQKSVKVFLRKA